MKTVDKDIELMKVQILHEISLQKTILNVSSALTILLTCISIMFTILQAPQIQRLDEAGQFTVWGIYLIISIIVLVYVMQRVETTARNYDQKLQKISDILEEIRKGKELPKLEEISKEF